MTKTKTPNLFTTIRVLKKSLAKLHDINKQEVKEVGEPVAEWKTFENIISEKHNKIVKSK